MKNILFTFAGLFISVLAFSQANGDTIISNAPQNLRVKVLYFHITNRCNTCMAIEENVRKTLFGNFGEQIDKGFIDLYILNCELPENQELVEKYGAYGSTLAITSFKSGTEQETEDLSNWSFKKVNKPSVFNSELVEKINKLLR